MMNGIRRNSLWLLATLLTSGSALAYDPSSASDSGKNLMAHQTPKELEGIGITEHLGDKLDMNLTFTDDTGQTVRLGSLFDGNKPVLLTMVYYNCPNLCSLVLNGLVNTFKDMKWTAGEEFRVIAVSMDHTETAEVAHKKKLNYLKEYGRMGGATDWHFMVGKEDQVKKLADALGFRFRWDEATKQFAHSAASYVLTPNGVLSRYMYGIEASGRDMRLAFTEAGEGKIGTIIDQLILYCFHFDPTRNKYVIYAWNLMRISAVFMVIALFIVLVPFWLREKRPAV